MGILGLKTFIEDRELCPGGSSFVNISDQVEKILPESGRAEASLAVDTNSCIFNWYSQTNRQGFTGGQWKEYKITLQNYITNCKNLNIKLVFFFDGTTELGKRSEWYARQKAKLRENEALFSCLDKGDTPKNKSHFVHTIPFFTKYILASLGQTVICTDGDADYDIMKFAIETPQCIGVVANDSDYLAYMGSKSVFPPECFYPKDNKAKMWNKSALLQSLGLEEEDLPVFACLMGNDLTTNYVFKLKQYKLSLGGESALSVASKIISFKFMNGYNLNLLQQEILPNCKEFVFSDVVRSYILPNQSSSWIQSYHYTIGNESTRTNKYQCSENLLSEAKLHSHWIHEILKFGVQKALTSYEFGIFEPQFVLYRYIRVRLYGIILSEIESENKFVEEWIGYNYDGDIEMCEPVPVTYKRQQVTLQQLWDPICENDYKICIFEQCLGLPGHILALKDDAAASALPEPLIVSSYLLSYMAQNMSNITQHDLECFIECAVWCNDVSVSFIKDLPVVVPKPQGVELASHYGRGLQLLLNANIVCGEPFNRESFIPSCTFDGLLFQAIYQEPMKYKKTPNTFRKVLMDLCTSKISSHSTKKYLQRITSDIETLSLRPQYFSNK